MLSPIVERENKDTFITKSRLSLETASTSPFERLSSVVLSRNLESLDRTIIDASSWKTVMPVTGSFSLVAEENYIENASRDLARNPNNPYLMNNLGKLFLKIGKFAEAIELFKNSLKIKSDFLLSKLNLASAYELKGDDATAIEIYKEILATNPNDVRATVNIGNIHLKNKKIQEAKQIFETVLKDYPDNVTSLDRLSIIYLIEGNPGKSINLLKKLRSLNANLPAVYNNLGVAYAATARYKNAIESFKISLRLSPDYRNAVINLANAFDKENEVDAAIDILEKYLKSHESNQAQELLAGLYIKVGKPQKTIYYLRKLLAKTRAEKMPGVEIGRLLNNIAVVYHKMREFEEAEKLYLESVNEGGYAHPVILANLMDLNFDLDRVDGIKRYLDIMKKSFPDNNVIYSYEGRLLYRMGEFQNAVHLLSLSIEKAPNVFSAYQLLGYIYCEFYKDLNRAIEIAEKAINKWPKNKAAINNLAYFYLRNQQIDKAKVLLKDVQDNLNNAGILNATVGLLRIKEGQIAEGSSLYNYAQKLAPTQDLQRQIEQKKNLELGRYFIEQGDVLKAKDYLNKVFSIKGGENIFTQEAHELYSKLIG